ncbi:bis(5'-nucleosyl)-tetraphosphatase (symmetrical) YqeK [Anaerosphaera multitolerans]|uniref:bis(5'-nucleosyl)-tetraphosphatase (symmetrical) n=1 Tax=Anaerosphaera multitolerans TaxID=2487351 RepID=A0A437S787_9FIRM|nr:bis(5'-nucleosyl)-tetraphosphatase (symmetrical) YqeK [Anaerosphaera multitolerans]RVU54915.1 HD domain-containing protein [Anaerosphaera multitolerans]
MKFLYEEDIINRIGEKRFKHTLRVVDTAKELAQIYGADLEKTKIAAYYHDCAKIKDYDKLIEECRKYDLKLTKEMKAAPQIIHSYLGAIIAEKKYGVKDKEILNAIRYHTTGRESMTLLEKIVFLADYIEPMRNFNGVERARELAKVNLDNAVYFSLNNTLSHLCKSNDYIVLDTVKARNFILEMEDGKIF